MRWATGILAATSLLLVGCWGAPARVDGITIANPSDYDLDVDVIGADRDGWLPVAIVPARGEVLSQEVIDQGDVWIFRFLHATRWGSSP